VADSALVTEENLRLIDDWDRRDRDDFR
jgi:hypothetical protein